MAKYEEKEWMTVKAACLEFDISEPALRKAIKKERDNPGAGVVSHHFAELFGVLVNRKSMKEYHDRTRKYGKLKGRPPTREVKAPSGRRPGRPSKFPRTEEN